MQIYQLLLTLVLWLGSMGAAVHRMNPQLDFLMPVAAHAPCGAAPAQDTPPDQVRDWFYDARFPPVGRFYPPIASRQHEQGTTVVAVCILPSGWTGDAAIKISSGSAQLDAAAILSAGYWHFVPKPEGIENRPEWQDIAVRFILPKLGPPTVSKIDTVAFTKRGPNVIPPLNDPSIPHAAQYPPLALRHQEEGSAIVDLVIEPDGDVGDARVTSSSGSRQLDAMALTSCGYWRYFPATTDGKPARTRWRTRISFRLTRSGLAVGPPGQRNP